MGVRQVLIVSIPICLLLKISADASSHDMRRNSRQSHTKATTLTRTTRTLNPNTPLHRLHQPFANIESQPRPTCWPGQIALETYKLLKQQCKLFGRDTRTSILHRETDR